jgi:hypothetical protein
MPLQYLIEFLNRAAVVQGVEMIEGGAVERIVGTKGQTCGRIGSFGGLGSCGPSRKQKHHAEKQIAIGRQARKQMGIP